MFFILTNHIAHRIHSYLQQEMNRIRKQNVYKLFWYPSTKVYDLKLFLNQTSLRNKPGISYYLL